jgi:hypothetical protein
MGSAQKDVVLSHFFAAVKRFFKDLKILWKISCSVDLTDTQELFSRQLPGQPL